MLTRKLTLKLAAKRNSKVRRLAAVLSGILIALALTTLSQAQSNVALAWNASSDSTVTGYYMYYGPNSATYTNRVSAGNSTSNTVPNLVKGGTYYFAVTAYNAAGLESDPSNEVVYTVPSSPTVALTAPVSGATYAAPALINCTASVTANGHTITKVQFYNGTSLLGEDTSSPYSFAWSSVSAGSYSLTARLVYDSGSTLDSGPISVTVGSLPPTIALTAPVNGTSFTAPATITCAASVISNGHTITKVQFYNGASLLGEDSSSPYTFTWASVSAGSYNVSARLIYDTGGTVVSAPASVSIVPPQPSWALTFAADSGTLTAPFVATAGVVSQTVQTGVANGGRAVYGFTLTNAGDYVVSALVNAPNSAANSLYVNIDAEPADPTMIWDLAITSGFTNQTVSWRGNGTDTSPRSANVFSLSAGTHQLIVRGREANTQLGAITIAPSFTVFPAITCCTRLANGNFSLNGMGGASQTCVLLAASSLAAPIVWTPIATNTAGPTGAFSFVDPNAGVYPNRVYRIQVR